MTPIKNETDYQAALKELGAFFDSNPDAASQSVADYYKALARLVEQYETAQMFINT